MTLISRIVIAVVIAIVAGLLLVLLGNVLDQLKVAIATTIGGFLHDYGMVFGVLAGLWYFFLGYNTFTVGGPKV